MEIADKKISFQDYYKGLAELQGDLRNRICTKLEITPKTFYNKINADSWSTLEREAIEKIVDEIHNEISNSL